MSSTSGWHGGLLLSAAFVSGTAWAGNGAPLLVIEWSINGGAVNLATPPGTLEGDGYDYIGVLTDPATGLELNYNITGNPLSAVAGNVKILNELKSEILVAVDVKLMLDPDLKPETLLSGVVTIGLTNGPGGGQITSVPPAVFRTLIDGFDAGFFTTLFWDQFQLGSSGQGNLSTQAHYGIPTPVPGPPLFSSLGYKLQFQLTPGDLASILVDMTADGEPTFCAEDLDASGTVGLEDLFTLAALWGPCGDPGNCAPDLNLDESVGMTDMLMLLQAWGPCK
jgi:hypothetical protein